MHCMVTRCVILRLSDLESVKIESWSKLYSIQLSFRCKQIQTSYTGVKGLVMNKLIDMISKSYTEYRWVVFRSGKLYCRLPHKLILEPLELFSS